MQTDKQGCTLILKVDIAVPGCFSQHGVSETLLALSSCPLLDVVFMGWQKQTTGETEVTMKQCDTHNHCPFHCLTQSIF